MKKMQVYAATLDWTCSKCGSLKRVEVTDVSRSVYSFRPDGGWVMNQGLPVCGVCVGRWGAQIPLASPPSPSSPLRTSEDVRASLTGLHVGQTREEPAHLLRQPPEPARPTYGASGGGADAKPAESISGPPTPIPGTWAHQPIPASPPSLPEDKVFRPGEQGNIAFVDTRNDEFLGPQKLYAGVPSLTEKCVGLKADGTPCNQVVADGSRWRMANGSTFERGHSECLSRAGK